MSVDALDVPAFDTSSDTPASALRILTSEIWFSLLHTDTTEPDQQPRQEGLDPGQQGSALGQRGTATRRARSSLVTRWAGLVLPVATAAALRGLALIGWTIPNPVLVFALAIVTSAYLGGVTVGLVSAGVTFAYTLVAWSMPGALFHYKSSDVQRLFVEAATMPAMAVLVGVLQARLRRRVVLLEAALADVKQLEGLIPICMYCKQVRGDAGYWERIEAYVSSRSGATFTHGICPECVRTRDL
jgi:K+-sensing histidine kinase KdpD